MMSKPKAVFTLGARALVPDTGFLNGAVFRHWVPDMLIPSAVPEYKVETLYSGTGTRILAWLLEKKRCAHISAHQE